MSVVAALKVAGEPAKYLFWCPGCQSHMWFDTSGRWVWNGDVEKPTVQPSILCFADNPEKRCHLYVVDGKLNFLNDCGHEYAGRVVAMETLPVGV